MKSLFLSVLGLLLFVAPAQAQQAPDFTLRNLENQEVSLSELRGKVVLINFWATWCGPCQVEMPHLQRMHEELGEQGLTILAISVDESTSSRVEAAHQVKRFTFPVLMDTNTEVVTQYNPQKTLPYSVLVDREGSIVWRHSGYSPGDEVTLEAKAKELLGQP